MNRKTNLALGLSLSVVALGACGQWNLDAARSAREDMHPGDYTRTPYYAIWLKAAKRLMVEKILMHIGCCYAFLRMAIEKVNSYLRMVEEASQQFASYISAASYYSYFYHNP